ncbi:hypothetical protein BJ684DRAFT_8641 [Piptocephalis cylindrospora]|uniref:Translation initiation factor eIF2B subunit delta n=1 Tax=Piptocephalis cylindrospora TaxID=1907219 RepID=A0A4P9Y6J9_9FUNG|nr:hypothetical protein BJ684DRAFT_8641 [Piptocephalis cylindrospora]|eukprot:RKP14412.1 hypothetical protein BJ684DRAFT_8641 [Piptocephalis cylindrospora]
MDGTAVPAVKKSQKDMTKAERKALQDQQRAEKQARRAAVLAERGGGGSPASSGHGKSGAGKTSGTPTIPITPTAPTSTASTSTSYSRNEYWEQASLLSHIEQAKGETHLAGREVHPAILQLGLLYKQRRICGGNARCVAMLTGFKRVIQDYQTPEHSVMPRHLPTHLSPQITFLVSMRPMSVGMGNAIRYVKYEISILPPEWSEDQSKEHLIQRIDDFIRERITLADQEIMEAALDRIIDGDVIAVYGRSSIVERTLLEAHRQGRQFRVIVIDGRPLNEGRWLAKILSDKGIQVLYTEIHGLSYIMEEATKVLFGAHAILGNGAILGRVGMAAVALAAKGRRVPVVVCAETYKMTERVQLDAYVHNEIGPAELLVKQKRDATAQPEAKAPLEGWEERPGLEVLNLMYDVTPVDWVGVLITDVGPVPCSSVPVLLREYRPMTYQ